MEIAAELHGHTDIVWQVCWSHDGKYLASCSSDHTIRLWTLIGGKDWQCIQILDDAPKRTIRSVSFSPDDKFLAAASFDSTTTIWLKDGNTYELLASLEGHENEVKSVSWSASGEYLATCGRDKSVWIWEVDDENDFQCAAVLQEHTQDVKCVRWHHTENVLASSSYDNTIRIWHELDSEWYCSNVLSGHEGTVWFVEFDHFGRLITCSDDKSLRLWSRINDTYETLFSIKPHSRSAYALSIHKTENMLASCGGDNRICLFSIESDKLSLQATIERAHQADVNTVAWSTSASNSKYLASGGDDGIVKIWRVVDE